MIRTITALRPEHGAAHAPRVRTVRVALAGCGVVGSAFVRLLQSQEDRFLHERGLRFEIARVLVRNPERERGVSLKPSLITAQLGEFLHSEADILVEAVGGIEPSLEIVRSALARGARVVTANKALIAAAGPELAALAQLRGGSLDFEASVAAGIPIIRTLRSALAARAVRSIRGILNGTTNYILNAIERGTPFREALKEAQHAGFAEADPTRDLNGTDAREKLAILAWLAWGVAPNALHVRQRGIEVNADRLVRDAVAVAGSVRLIAECVRNGSHLSASVEPSIVARVSDAGRTFNENNLVRLEFENSPPLQLSGPGAGGFPTASALLADVLQACGPLRQPNARLASYEGSEARYWLVSVTANGARAYAQLRAVGASARVLENGRGLGRVLVGPCSWPQLAPVLEQLEAAGHEPAAARLDMEV
ncbi:MAG: homoserine dehydrogenase [Gemmatimonadota bacterium]